MSLDVTKGLTPTKKQDSGYNNGGLNTYPIANGLGQNIGFGDPVKLSAGLIKLAENTTPTLGVFQGFRYVDDSGQLKFKKNFVTSTESKTGVDVGGGYTQPLAFVAPGENTTFVVRTADSVSVSQGLIGKSFRMSAIGSVVNGISQAVLDVAATADSSSGHMVTITGLWTGRGSEWGDAPTAVEVKLSNPGIVGEL